MNEMPRRTVLRGAAWSVPVIAAAIATPLAAASEPTPQPTSGPPLGVCGFYHHGNNGSYYVYADKIVVTYNTPPDIYELNVKFKHGGSASWGTNYGTAPARGSLEWIVPLPRPATWVQCHGISDHFGETC